MDEDALNMRNWGYYEPSFKGQLGLQLMPSVVERDIKSFIPGHNPAPVMVPGNGSYHPRDCMVSEAPVPVPMEYMRNSWINQRDKYVNVFPANLSYPLLPEPSAAQPLAILPPPPHPLKDERMDGIEDPGGKKEGRQSKKRQSGGGPGPKTPQTSKIRKVKDNSNPSVARPKPAKKSMDVVINGIDMDISGIPIPVCSCTGNPQQCYRWGCGGWQSSCCTTNVSMHPLPMSTKRRGARIAGRKMSQGAFKKVLEKLAAEGYNFVNPIDLKNHWARHGTNKFVTIR